jgi:hypothetical protein
MTNDVVHPDEVLQALLAKGNRRDKEQKLRRLHELCSIEYGRRSQVTRDLSLANMSRAAERDGIFKARTIYNKQSEDYVTVVKAWDAYNGPKESKLIKHQVPAVEKYAFLKKINDPAIRGLCQMGLIERDKLRAELNMLKSQTQVIVDMRPLGAQLTGGDNVAVIELSAQLTNSEQNALAAAINPEILSKKKWTLGETGEVIDERGRFVFDPGFATGIAKIVSKKCT